MTDREAQQILDWLTGTFGKRLQENEQHVWMATLIELDANRAMEIALQLGKAGERFPTVPEFRRLLRVVHNDESWRDLPAELPPIPEWTFVWFWSMTTRGAAHRPFPQFYPRPADVMTMAEYEQVRADWQAAGAPHFSSVGDIVRAVS